MNFNDQPIGKLLLGVSRRQIDQNFEISIYRMLLSNALIIVFFSVCIYVGFRVMAMLPKLRRKNGLNRAGHGEFDQTVHVIANDKIGSLTHSFNHLVGELRKTIAEKDNIAVQLQEQARELENLNRDLESRVEESSRIMRDLHDDVGAKLLTLAHRSGDEANAETARAALQSLREIIRGLDVQDMVVALDHALADWRGEATERLDSAGIALSWKQPHDLPAYILNNRQRNNLGRVIREAISNAICHANPCIIEITSSVMNNVLQIAVCDNGPDTDVEHWEADTGLNSMIRRASELEGELHWYPATKKQNFTSGVCIEISCPLSMKG